MNKLVESIGEDLAEKVKRENLPTAELEVSNPKSKEGLSLFSRVLWTMRRGARLSFVSQKVDYASSYVNALALLFDNDAEWRRSIAPYEEFRFSEDTDSDGGVFKHKLQGKRFFVADMKLALTVAQDSLELWDEILNALHREEFTQKYFLVWNNLPYLFDGWQSKNFSKQGSSFNYFTKYSGFNFHAPMGWQDFSMIEQTNPFLVHFLFPVLFSPRPANLPPARHSFVDGRWKFE